VTPTVTKNEQIVRDAYKIAEVKNLKGWVDAFTWWSTGWLSRTFTASCTESS
jgi:hypothetical protein